MKIDPDRIRGAWLGRVSGCRLGRPLELLSMFKGREALRSYLDQHGAWPLRDYVPAGDEPLVTLLARDSCRDRRVRAEADDDTNYTVLALIMLEEKGAKLTTHEVAGAWLRYLPAGYTFTAERAAYRALLDLAPESALLGLPAGLDLSPCSDHQYNDWIGAQIRADLYGWVCPGRPEPAARLAAADAALSHRGEGVHGAVFVAALGASIPAFDSLEEAIDRALAFIPSESEAARAVALGRSLAGKADAVEVIHERYGCLNPVHTVNNLCLVVWGLLQGADDFGRAVGETVAAGWDTDCNGATVGGLWGLTGRAVPEAWTSPWQGRLAVNLAGVGELAIDDLVARTVRLTLNLLPSQ